MVRTPCSLPFDYDTKLSNNLPDRYQVFYYACGQITSLLQLAIDLVIDLDLNRPPNISDKPKTVSEAMRFVYGHKPKPVSGSLEERRAFLGCFYISSMYILLPRLRVSLTLSTDDAKQDFFDVQAT